MGAALAPALLAIPIGGPPTVPDFGDGGHACIGELGGILGTLSSVAQHQALGLNLHTPADRSLLGAQ